MGLQEGTMFVPTNRKYSELMKFHEESAAYFEETILKYAKASIKTTKDKQVMIADLCTADGVIAQPIIEKVINLIKKTIEDVEILVVFEGKEDNNYNALFETVSKAKPLLFDDIFVMACATSMYKQCLPSNSTQFIFCNYGIQYLSERPCLLKNSMLTTNCSPEEKQIYKKHAAKDWKLFLQHRSKELKPGGVLFILVQFDKYPDYGQLDVVLKSILTDKLINEKEFVNISWCNYLRTEEELRQPFEEGSQEVIDLEIVTLEILKKHVVMKIGSDIREKHLAGTQAIDNSVTVSVLEKTFLADKNKYFNAICFGTDIIGRQRASTIMEMIRTWSYHAIVSHLDTDRTDESQQQIGDEFYKRLEENIALLIGDYCYHTQRIVIRKKM